jgi:hypothetical protein
MKKFLILLIAFAIMFTSCGYFEPTTESINRETVKASQVQNNANALTTYPTPIVKNFLERKTVSEWVKRWDQPSVLTYCYIFIGQNCIGYFITNGKPASANSFLIPEDYVERDGGQCGGGNVVRQSLDLDGTYGSNNPGYRFFLANGTAVECSGTMVSCVYADAPLSINCPEITAIKK